MDIVSRLKSKALDWVKPLPFRCRHIEYSTIASLDDQFGAPTQRLFDVSLAAVAAALESDLSDIAARMQTDPRYPNVWPGEHYKLLAGFMASLRPRKVIEVGTFQGLGTLALLSHLPPSSQLITLDVIPWQQIDSAILRDSDFEDGRLKQVIGDLSNPAFAEKFAPELADCDFMFVDAPKDIVFETAFLQLMERLSLDPKLLIVFDDIRVWNMLSIWRGIKRPKLDLTSFGHWSGTGIVEWNGTA